MHSDRRAPHIRSLIGVLAMVPLAAACSSDNGSKAMSSRDASSVSTSASATGPSGSRDPLPPLVDPSAPLACDGAAVLCVDGTASSASADGTAAQPFTTVGDALAAIAEGGTIQVAAGTYAEPIVFNGVNGINLVGGFVAGGDFSSRDSQANETVLQGTKSTSVVLITSSSAIRVEGFRLTGGGGTTDSSSWVGGGVSIDAASSDIAIVSNRIDSNAVDQGDDAGATFGGGISSFGSDVSIVSNVIENNRAGRGSGISAQGTTTIQGNTVNDNVSIGDHGGGVYVYGVVSIIGNHIEGNVVGKVLGYGWGGGIIAYGDETQATLQGNTITGNLAVTGGSAVFVDNGADATLTDELYYANQCTIDGAAGVLVDSGGTTATTARLVNVTIAEHDCPVTGNGGQAVQVEVSVATDPPSEVTVSKSIFWGKWRRRRPRPRLEADRDGHRLRGGHRRRRQHQRRPAVRRSGGR